MIEIPFPEGLSSFETLLTLDTEVKKFYFEWNDRFAFWGYSIYTPDDVEIISGLKLPVNYEVFSKYHAYENMPQGKLYVIRNNGESKRVEFDSFTNGECSLIYKGVNE